MSLDISSFENRLNSPAQAGQAHRPVKENTRIELRANPEKSFDTNESKPDSKETGTLDQNIFTANHRVNFEVNPETQDVVIKVVDSESGEVIKQIPGEDFLKLTQCVAEFNQKLLDEIS